MADFTRISSLSKNTQSADSYYSVRDLPYLEIERKTCLLCNRDICGTISSSLENKQLFCRIFKVLPPSLSLENDMFNDRMFGSFCQFCSASVTELCSLERQISQLKSRMDQMQIKIANSVVGSFATTSCNQNGYFVKRQIYERWFERCHQVPVSIWESTPMPMSTQGPVVVGMSPTADINEENERNSTSFNISVVPVQNLTENGDNDDDQSSTVGNFALSPIQNEDSDDSVTIVSAPAQPVLPLPCVIRKVKRKKLHKKKHSKKKKRSDKKKRKIKKTKNGVTVGGNRKSNVNENIPNLNVAMNEDFAGSPSPPHLSPMEPDRYESGAEETINSQMQSQSIISTENNSAPIINVASTAPTLIANTLPAAINISSVASKKSVREKMYPDKFTCEFCGKRFNQKCNFTVHMRIHTGEKPYKCKICEKAFSSLGNMMSHEATHDKTRYDGEPQFPCELCDKKYFVKSTLLLHRSRRHHPNNRICEFCGAIVQDMKLHVEKLHTISEKRPSKCSTCHFTFADDFYLQMHQSDHTSVPLLYQCTICRRGLKKRNKLNQHLKQVHKITDFSSATAVAPASECVKQMEHRKKKEKVPKGPRGRPRGRPPGMTSTSSSTRANKEPPSKEPKTYMCEICGKISKQKFTHLIHLRVHSGEKPHKCRFCDRMFNDTGNRLKHEVTHDKSRFEGEPRFECNDCGKKFHLRGTLYVHIRKNHMEVVPRYYSKMECDICGAMLRQKKSLLAHKRRFHSEQKISKPFQCVTCLKVFAKEYTLKIHQFEHKKEIECDNFKCVHCPPLSHELFTKEDLQEHYKECHPEIKKEDIVARKTYKCPDCPLTYILLRSVLEHIGREHENIKGTRRIRNRRKTSGKRKVGVPSDDSESEDDEFSMEQEKINKKLQLNAFKSEYKHIPPRQSKRVQQQSKSLLKRATSPTDKSDSKIKAVPKIPQMKELRIVLRRVDQEMETESDIEIKQEFICF